MARKKGVSNPVSVDEGRFDPATDAENAAAHDMEPQTDYSTKDSDIQDTIRRSLERAIRFHEDEIEPGMVEATEYYHGEPFGDEQEGRSKVVSMDIHDATQAQLPSLLRIFLGSENAVEFRAKGPEDEEVARQMTDYVRYVISEDNDGFVTLTNAFTDALVRDIGVVKWWQDEFYRVEASKHTGLSMEDIKVFALDPDCSISALTSSPDGMTFDVTVTRTKSRGCQRIAAVPPEELVFTPRSRSLDTAPLVAHVRKVPRDELVALGIDEETIDDAVENGSLRSDDMEDARHQTGDDEDDTDDLDPSQQPILFAEVYSLVDGDGDGKAELRLFQCIGPKHEIVNGDGGGEIVDEIPFAVFTPELEPHSIIGRGNHKNLKDIQRIKSQVLRGTLDSLALALEPKTEAVEGEVNVADLIAPEINGIVRVRKPGMLREITHQFMGMATLPVLEHFNEIKEQRTGHNRAAAGLDADSLQSSTKAAVAATLSASQQRIEMIARIFAETGIKRMFKGLLRLIVKHPDPERMVRLRGTWVKVDPRHWDSTMDVTVNVALGQGSAEERAAMLQNVLQWQMEQHAAGSPLVSLVEIRNTFASILEMSGFKNADRFAKPWGPAEEAQFRQMMAQQEPPPNPDMALVMVEQWRVQQAALMEERKFELEQWKAQREDDRQREKIARDAALKEYELELKHAVEIEDVKLKAKVAADRAAMDTVTKEAA